MKILIYIDKNFNTNSINTKNNNKSTISISSIESVVAAASKIAELNASEITAVIPNGDNADFELLGDYGITNIINIINNTNSTNNNSNSNSNSNNSTNNNNNSINNSGGNDSEFNSKRNSKLTFFNVVSKLKKIIYNNYYDIVLFPSSTFCSELAPYLSIKSSASYSSDIINFELDEEKNLLASKYIYSGKVVTKIKSNTKLKIFTIAINLFDAVFQKEEYTVTNEPIDDEYYNPNLICELLEFKETLSEKNIADAKTIVAVGRGIGETHNLQLIKEFAEALSAAIAFSRVLVDAGVAQHASQVGQTGQIVSPDVYIACGISGAPQHTMGMSKSKYIIAINKDKNAPIFEISDVVVVGNMFNILPSLVKELIF